MTTPPLAPRPSVSVAVSTAANNVLTKLLCLFMAAFFGHLLWVEIKAPVSSNITMWVFAGLTTFFVAMVITDAVINTLGKLLSLVGPYLPQRRKDDPQP